MVNMSDEMEQPNVLDRVICCPKLNSKCSDENKIKVTLTQVKMSPHAPLCFHQLVSTKEVFPKLKETSTVIGLYLSASWWELISTSVRDILWRTSRDSWINRSTFVSNIARFNTHHVPYIPVPLSTMDHSIFWNIHPDNSPAVCLGADHVRTSPQSWRHSAR